ncbi:thiol peroxidase [Martelella alba]|uniref:Thiol peroxidase n=1 Tax=Martelella alba TaxID=2590451 RepID=A0ABY2SQ48_9HYPH|nr:thiol peroxidase [Martelella alba]TKI08091.1 thiol peroxidase [Martelella alba]
MSRTVYFQGKPFRVADTLPRRGQTARDFSLVAKDLSDITLNNHAGKRKVMNIFPSIDTAICAATVRRFDEMAACLAETVVLCISADLPFAQSRFCGAQGLHRVVTLSTLRDAHFKSAYGVDILDGPLKGLTARASLVLDEHDRVIYSHMADDIIDEPPYEDIWTAARRGV